MGQTVIGFEVQIGSATFTHNQSNGLLSVIMEDHVDMASVCSINREYSRKSTDTRI